MDVAPKKASALFILVLLTGRLRGLDILEPEETRYIHQSMLASPNDTVTLPCGSSIPNVFIWVFSPPGTGNTTTTTALAYNYGPGPKVLDPARGLGDPKVPSDSSSLVLERLSGAAGGTYTCQALYDAEQGPKVAFYVTQLGVRGSGAADGTQASADEDGD